MDLEHEQQSPGSEGEARGHGEFGILRQPRMKIGVVAALAALGAGIWYINRPAPRVDVFGTLRLAAPGYLPDGNGACEGTGGYDDITAGTAVTVGGASGQTLGIGSLGSGVDQGFACVFPFDVAVPGGQSIYTVTISHRGTQTLTPAEVAAGITLTLG